MRYSDVIGGFYVAEFAFYDFCFFDLSCKELSELEGKQGADKNVTMANSRSNRQIYTT